MRATLALLVVALLALGAGGAEAALQETPYFADVVAGGKLPPVVQRIPREPALAELETLGKPGGDLRMLMASPKDTRMMVVYGYARLVAYTPALAIVPDMLLGIDVDDGRSFTLHLRPGHKWSDGQPFTSEDFRYWFQDIAENSELSQGRLAARRCWRRRAAEVRGDRRDHDRAIHGRSRTRSFCRRSRGPTPCSSTRRLIT